MESFQRGEGHCKSLDVPSTIKTKKKNDKEKIFKPAARENDDAQAVEKEIAGRSDGGGSGGGGSGDDNDGHQPNQVSSEVSGAGAIIAGSESAVPCEVRAFVRDFRSRLRSFLGSTYADEIHAGTVCIIDRT